MNISKNGMLKRVLAGILTASLAVGAAAVPGIEFNAPGIVVDAEAVELPTINANSFEFDNDGVYGVSNPNDYINDIKPTDGVVALFASDANGDKNKITKATAAGTDTYTITVEKPLRLIENDGLAATGTVVAGSPNVTLTGDGTTVLYEYKWSKPNSGAQVLYIDLLSSSTNYTKPAANSVYTDGDIQYLTSEEAEEYLDEDAIPTDDLQRIYVKRIDTTSGDLVILPIAKFDAPDAAWGQEPYSPTCNVVVDDATTSDAQKAFGDATTGVHTVKVSYIYYKLDNNGNVESRLKSAPTAVGKYSVEATVMVADNAANTIEIAGTFKDTFELTKRKLTAGNVKLAFNREATNENQVSFKKNEAAKVKAILTYPDDGTVLTQGTEYRVTGETEGTEAKTYTLNITLTGAATRYYEIDGGTLTATWSIDDNAYQPLMFVNKNGTAPTGIYTYGDTLGIEAILDSDTDGAADANNTNKVPKGYLLNQITYDWWKVEVDADGKYVKKIWDGDKTTDGYDKQEEAGNVHIDATAGQLPSDAGYYIIKAKFPEWTDYPAASAWVQYSGATGDGKTESVIKIEKEVLDLAAITPSNNDINDTFASGKTTSTLLGLANVASATFTLTKSNANDGATYTNTSGDAGLAVYTEVFNKLGTSVKYVKQSGTVNSVTNALGVLIGNVTGESYTDPSSLDKGTYYIVPDLDAASGYETNGYDENYTKYTVKLTGTTSETSDVLDNFYLVYTTNDIKTLTIAEKTLDTETTIAGATVKMVESSVDDEGETVLSLVSGKETEFFTAYGDGTNPVTIDPIFVDTKKTSASEAEGYIKVDGVYYYQLVKKPEEPGSGVVYDYEITSGATQTATGQPYTLTITGNGNYKNAGTFNWRINKQQDAPDPELTTGKVETDGDFYTVDLTLSYGNASADVINEYDAVGMPEVYFLVDEAGKDVSDVFSAENIAKNERASLVEDNALTKVYRIDDLQYAIEASGHTLSDAADLAIYAAVKVPYKVNGKTQYKYADASAAAIKIPVSVTAPVIKTFTSAYNHTKPAIDFKLNYTNSGDAEINEEKTGVYFIKADPTNGLAGTNALNDVRAARDDASTVMDNVNSANFVKFTDGVATVDNNSVADYLYAVAVVTYKDGNGDDQYVTSANVITKNYYTTAFGMNAGIDDTTNYDADKNKYPTIAAEKNTTSEKAINRKAVKVGVAVRPVVWNSLKEKGYITSMGFFYNVSTTQAQNIAALKAAVKGTKNDQNVVDLAPAGLTEWQLKNLTENVTNGSYYTNIVTEELDPDNDEFTVIPYVVVKDASGAQRVIWGKAITTNYNALS